jgi:hypothetical protein
MSLRHVFSIGVALALALVTLHAQQPKTFGAGVSLKETTPLAQLIDRPSDFEGKTVRVEGVVTAVCMHMGCWMALTPEKGADTKTMLIKVDDGVIVFPQSAKGRRAVAQGVGAHRGPHGRPPQNTRAAQARRAPRRRPAAEGDQPWCLRISNRSLTICRLADWQIARLEIADRRI